MKLLYITNAITGVGGLERVLSVKSSWLAAQPGLEVAICTLNDFEKSPFYKFSNSILHFDIKVVGNPIEYVRAYICGIRKVIKEFEPDVISVCDDGLRGLLFTFLFRFKNIAVVYERHVSKEINKSGYFTKLIYWMMDCGAKRFDRFVVLTEGNKREWGALSNIEVISNPLSFQSDQVSTLENKRVISVGKLSHQKGFDMLVDIWKSVNEREPQWEMHIYGARGTAYPLLNKKIEEAGLQNCFFLHGPDPNIKERYLESSIYVMSSRYEGFGMVLTEAMSCGVPCVSFDCPCGPGDIICHNEDGFLVESYEKTIMSDRICQLIENRNLREAMGQKARINVQRFSMEEIGKQWLSLFSDLINKRR